MNENDVGTQIVRISLDVHRNLGPGLLESAYETILYHELQNCGFSVQKQVPISLNYNGLTFDESFRADLVVDDKVIIELKSVEQVSKVHAKQLYTYLKLADLRLGYLLNFGAPLMKEGITRIVNNLKE